MKNKIIYILTIIIIFLLMFISSNFNQLRIKDSKINELSNSNNDLQYNYNEAKKKLEFTTMERDLANVRYEQQCLELREN